MTVRSLADGVRIRDAARPVSLSEEAGSCIHPSDWRRLGDAVEAVVHGPVPACQQGLRERLQALQRRDAALAPATAAAASLREEFRVIELEARSAARGRGLNWNPFARREAQGELLQQARRAWCEAVLREVDDGGDLAEAFGRRLHLLWRDCRATHDALVQALHAMRDHDDPKMRSAALRVSEGVSRWASDMQAEGAGASTAPRETSRMPNEVLVHVASLVDEALSGHPGDARLTALSAALRRIFLAHEAEPARIRKLAGDAALHLFRLGHGDAARACLACADQLPRGNATGVQALNRLQLNDNPYGRAFDSLFAAEVVRRAPPAMLSAVGAMGRAFNQQLKETPVNLAAANSYRAALLEHPRAWQALTPGHRAFLRAPPRAALTQLKRFLSSEPLDGPHAMAQLYLMTYFGLHQRGVVKALGRPERTPRYLQACAATHGVFRAQAVRESPAVDEAQRGTRDTGILLRHQPAATADVRLGLANRPAARYRIGHRQDSATSSRTEGTVFSPALDEQLGRGVAVGSGVSGSTHMLLHLYADLRDRGMTGVPARDVLLACATLMNYDGGHSLHEALWSGNLLDEKLGLGLGLSDADTPPEAYVARHDAFIRHFDDATRDQLQAATDHAWSGTQDYLRAHSHFARAGRPGGGGAAAPLKPPANAG